MQRETDPLDTPEEIARLLHGKKSGSGWSARCPAHEDGTASLSISRGTKQPSLLRCHTGCTFEEIIAAIRRLRGSPPQVERSVPTARKRTRVAEYLYRNADGTPFSTKTRYVDEQGEKTFFWKPTLNGARAPLYRLDEIQGKEEVLVPEGEKDVDRLWSLGLPATCNAHGASKNTQRSKWTDEDTKDLVSAGVKRVAILRDEDGPGIAHAHVVAQSCQQAGILTKPVELPDLPDKKGADVSDWLDAGHTKIELQQAVMDAAVYDLDPALDVEPAEEPLEVVRARAREILDLEDPLTAVEAAIRAQGYGGSTNPPLIVYIAATSRLLRQGLGSSPCHLLIIATSGGGKTYTEQIVCLFLPQEAIHRMSAGSARALIYDTGDLQHRSLIFGEADSLPSDEDNPAASAIRNLLQDNVLSYDVVVKDPKGKGFKTQKIIRPGPTQFITTSTRRFRDQQMSTRVFELEIPTDAQKVRASLKVQAHRINHPPVAPSQALINFQSYLQRLAPWDVQIPYADALADLIGRHQHEPRILRDFTKLLALVQAVAIIRHAHREQDAEGRVVATLADYATVRGLVGDMYETAVTGATESVRQVADAVRGGAKSEPAVVKALTVINGACPARASVYRWVGTAILNEWVRNEESNTKKPKILAAGEPVPERVQLPTLEAVASWGCPLPTVLPEPKARESGSGVDRGATEECASPSGEGAGNGHLPNSINESTEVAMSHESALFRANGQRATPGGPLDGACPLPKKQSGQNNGQLPATESELLEAEGLVAARDLEECA
jgi:hypothetical protein